MKINIPHKFNLTNKQLYIIGMLYILSVDGTISIQTRNDEISTLSRDDLDIPDDRMSEN